MKNLFLCFLIFSCSLITFAQEDSITLGNFQLTLKERTLQVFDNDGKIVYKKEFNNPSGSTLDLDDDGIDEYLVLDSNSFKLKPSYTLFIFNTAENFSLVDSILSGSIEPYETNSEDVGGTVIIAGNTDFEQFNQGDNYFLPINCWRYEDSSVFMVNDEVYNIYLNENEGIIDYLDENFESHKDCAASSLLKAPIAAAYVNYINAGEKSVASQFLKNYYLCNDINQFKKQLNDLIKGDQ
jgi:hypothetical protein